MIQAKTPGGKVAALRAQLGLSQSEFARRLGVNQTTVSRWESGRQVPGKSILIRLRELSYDLNFSRGLSPEIALVEHSPFPMAIISQEWEVVAVSDPLLQQENAERAGLQAEGGRKRSSADMEQAFSILRDKGFFDARIPACRIVARAFIFGQQQRCFDALCTPLPVKGRICRLMQYRFLREDEFAARRGEVGLITFLDRRSADRGAALDPELR
jgi:transcriptional regulator with XRE-family HTH domain